jgi:hypothetical protein
VVDSVDWVDSPIICVVTPLLLEELLLGLLLLELLLCMLLSIELLVDELLELLLESKEVRVIVTARIDVKLLLLELSLRLLRETPAASMTERVIIRKSSARTVVSIFIPSPTMFYWVSSPLKVGV